MLDRKTPQGLEKAIAKAEFPVLQKDSHCLLEVQSQSQYMAYGPPWSLKDTRVAQFDRAVNFNMISDHLPGIRLRYEF
jgi:hypothetical protein